MTGPCVNEALLYLDIGNARDKLHAEVIRAELDRLRAALREIAREQPLGSGMTEAIHGHSARAIALAALTPNAAGKAPPADTRKPCTCDGAGRGPGRTCRVQAGQRLGELWRCAQGLTPNA